MGLDGCWCSCMKGLWGVSRGTHIPLLKLTARKAPTVPLAAVSCTFKDLVQSKCTLTNVLMYIDTHPHPTQRNALLPWPGRHVDPCASGRPIDASWDSAIIPQVQRQETGGIQGECMQSAGRGRAGVHSACACMDAGTHYTLHEQPGIIALQ